MTPADPPAVIEQARLFQHVEFQEEVVTVCLKRVLACVWKWTFTEKGRGYLNRGLLCAMTHLRWDMPAQHINFYPQPPVGRGVCRSSGAVRDAYIAIYYTLYMPSGVHSWWRTHAWWHTHAWWRTHAWWLTHAW